METAHIKISAQIEGRFLALPSHLDVKAGTAELYGYKSSECEKPSVLDALIQLHIQLFGLNSQEELKEYLLVSPSGTIRMMFGIPSEAVGFSINGAMPNDGQISPLFGEYMGFFASKAELADGDSLRLFFFADSFYSDQESWFEHNEARADIISAKPDENISLRLMGYYFMYYGASPELNEKIIPLDHAQAGIVNEDGEILPIEGKVTGMQGKIDIAFSQPGVYIVSAVSLEDFRYIVCPQITVSVS